MEFGNNSDEGHSEGEEGLHFYYNREERLKNAPQPVKDFYSGNFKLNKGFRALVGSRANRVLLVTMAICIVFVLFTSVLSSSDKGKIGSAGMRLTAFAYEEEIYVSLKINASKTAVNIPVEMAALCYDADKQPSVTHKVSEIYKGQELFLRTKFSDYDILTVKAEVTVSGQKQTLQASVQRH